MDGWMNACMVEYLLLNEFPSSGNFLTSLAKKGKI